MASTLSIVCRGQGPYIFWCYTGHIVAPKWGPTVVGNAVAGDDYNNEGDVSLRKKTSRSYCRVAGREEVYLCCMMQRELLPARRRDCGTPYQLLSVLPPP